MDVRRDSLVLLNLKNPSRLTKRVFLPTGQMDLPGALLLWAKEHGLADGEPLFFSRKRGKGGGLHAISRQQAWEIVRAASERADVRVLALRASMYGRAGEPAPVHPHLFRHARVRQIVRATKSLPIAQKQAGWSRLQMAYLSVSDDEVRDAILSLRTDLRVDVTLAPDQPGPDLHPDEAGPGSWQPRLGSASVTG
jgi:integrase